MKRSNETQLLADLRGVGCGAGLADMDGGMMSNADWDIALFPWCEACRETHLNRICPMELHKECNRLRKELAQVKQDKSQWEAVIVIENLQRELVQMKQDCEQAGVMLADAHSAMNEHMEIHAKVVNELNEAKEEIAWYGTLVRRTKIGTHETPSLRAYIEQLEARLVELEGQP